MKGKKHERKGVISQGIKTPIINPGDDLQEIVISRVATTIGGKFEDGDIIAVTEAVVATSQSNFVTYQNIGDDIASKFVGAKELVIVDPIQSRNRFIDVLIGISQTPGIEKVYIVLTYPTDEVGNRLVSDMEIMESGINPYQDVLTMAEFISKFGEPKHQFTGVNYPQEYVNACKCKAEVIFCNDFLKIPSVTKCNDILICSIHRRKQTRKILEKSGAKRIFDLSEIMNKPIDGSGYNEEFGLYGTNKRKGEKLKLLPRDSQTFVEGVQAEIQKRYGKQVEVMVYGDGAFKDPLGGIWELADPQTTFGRTSKLKGMPKEVKLKYIASANEGKTSEQIEEIVAEEREKRISTDDISEEKSLGTTPREITDLIASLADLTSGSGDRQTPVVLIRNYL